MVAPDGDWEDRLGNASQAVINNNERELLRRIWSEADVKATAFVSIDTEYLPKHITELGIATRQKRTPTMARHLVVNCNRELRARPPKPFSFGLSEEVRYEGDLAPIMSDTLTRLIADNEVVVLTGHDVQKDLHMLRVTCGWRVPDSVIILDTLRIWRSCFNRPDRGNLKDALEFFGVYPVGDEFHNAGNDAWYTMDLLVHKANQAVEFPIRMSKTAVDYVPRDKKTSAGKKRRREDEQADESGHDSQLPDYSVQPRRSKRRKRNDGGDGIHPAPRHDTANPVVIDLTGDTPPPQEPTEDSHEVDDRKRSRADEGGQTSVW